MVFLTALTHWIITNKWILGAYLIILILIIINRKKFQVESGFILLYRTQFGIKSMEKFAEKHKEFLKILGYTAIGIGFVGMFLICGLLLKGLYELVFVPTAAPTLSLVIPGVQIPGSPIFVPFVYGILALFIVVVVHEFGHGIIAKAHGLKIRNTGFGFMGPLPLAFVEPDEKQVVKKDSVVQQSIFAAGPFFNGLLVILMLALIFVVSTILVGMTAPQGFHFSEIQPGYSAEKYGILANHTYTTINGAEINTMTELTKVMSTVKPNETLTIGDSNGNTTLITSASPKDSSKGYLGVMGVTADYKLKSDNKFHRFLFNFLMMLSNPFASNVVEYTLFQWIATLSLGIGLANLLPLGPVDGGRMLHKAAIDINGKDKGVKIWSTISIITLVTMILLVFVPIIKHVVFKM